MHKVTPQLLPEVTRTWQVALRAPSDLMVDCSQACTQWGWKYARLPYEPPPPLPAERADGSGWRGFGVRWNGTLRKIDPVQAGWRCCFLRTAVRAQPRACGTRVLDADAVLMLADAVLM